MNNTESGPQHKLRKKTSTVLVNIKLSGVLIKKVTASVSLPTHKSQAFPY